MGNPKYRLYKGKNGEFYFSLKAANGEPILQSQGYKAKPGALNGIESCRDNSPNEDRYDKLEAKNGQFYFNLKAGNGQIIGTSEMYKSTSGRNNGIKSVMKNGPIAEVDDETN